MTTKKPVCVVLGVGPGNGAACAQRFADGGYAVALLARRDDYINELAEGLDDARAYSVDVSNERALKQVFARIAEDMGPVSVLLYNVGSGVWGNVEALEPDALRMHMEINVIGLLISAQQVIPAMKEAGNGAIIVTGATASLRGGANFAGFATPKGAQRILAQSMARHLGPFGIHVALVIVDGAIEIDRGEGIGDHPADSKLKPWAIADTIFFLAHQPKSARTFELDLRPYVEKW